jgi:hypothetical protein
MALVVKDRVKETTTTTGTGSVTLAGASTGFQTFNSAIGVSNTTYYCIAGQGTSEWEVGLGTLSASTTLARTTVYASSNAGSAVTFSAGTKDVFCTFPAGIAIQQVQATVFNSGGTWTCPTGVTRAKVTVIGGGGCGGYNKGSNNGGVGGYASGTYDVTPGTGYSVTVGAGAVTGGPSGSAGGSSAFSSFLSATGGADGTTAASGSGTGGTIVNGNILYGRGALDGAGYGAGGVYPSNGTQGGVLIEYVG